VDLSFFLDPITTPTTPHALNVLDSLSITTHTSSIHSKPESSLKKLSNTAKMFGGCRFSCPLPCLVPDPTSSQLTNVADDNAVQPAQPSPEELRAAEAEANFAVQLALASVVSLYLCRLPMSMSPSLGAPLQVSMLTWSFQSPFRHRRRFHRRLHNLLKLLPID